MRGSRWLRAGAIGLIVVAVLHTMGHFGGGPPEPGRAALEQAMRDYRFDIMGMRPSAHDITNALSLTMTAFLLFVGAIDLALIGALATNPRAARRLALINVAGVASLVALFAYYRIPPPFVTLAVVDALFVAGLVRMPRQ